MKPRLPATDWNQLRAAYTAGGSLRGLARAAGIPEGTILARAKRESWTRLKKDALNATSRNQLQSRWGSVDNATLSEWRAFARH